MLEHRRQHYLSLLGIDNYIPTRLLTNAPLSSLLPDELLIDPKLLSNVSNQAQFIKPDDNKNIDESANENIGGSFDSKAVNSEVSTKNETLVASSSVINTSVANTSIVDTSIVAAQGPSALLEQELLSQEAQQKAIDDSGAQSSKQSSKKPEQINDSIGADQSPIDMSRAPVKFVFSVWRVKDILILDTRKVREALPTDHLLQNILRSVGYSVAQLPVSESLRWPLFVDKRFAKKNNGTDKIELTEEQYKNDSEQSRAMVQAYISAQHSKAPLKYLFLMGAETTSSTLDDSIRFVDCNGTVLSTKFWEGIQCLIMPSLYSMLQDPPSKRIAWNALQSMNKSSE